MEHKAPLSKSRSGSRSPQAQESGPTGKSLAPPTLQLKSEQPVAQRDQDTRVEEGSGVTQGISDGTMVQDGIMGQTYTVGSERDYTVDFKFDKAYKGVYPYGAASRDVKGVYVKIEATFNDHQKCGRCSRMQLIQVIRNVTQGSEGNMETADPGNETRRERSGWGDDDSASRGWRVDRLTSATDPYYSSSWTSSEGNESTPAVLRDAPGDWSTTTNAGKEFYSSVVCHNAAGEKRILASVRWGYYIDGSGSISFYPTTPTVMLGNPQQTQDAAERWDSIDGNTETGITF